LIGDDTSIAGIGFGLSTIGVASPIHGIIGATKITHLEDAAGALSVKLTQEEVAYLEEPYVPHPIVGHQ